MMHPKVLAFALVTVTACVGSPPDGGGTPDPSGGSPAPGGTDPGGGGTDPGGGGGGTLTVGQFLDGLGHKDCDEAFACQASFPTANGTFADAFGASATACYADAAGYYDATATQAEITAGKIHFDGVAAAACIAGITAPVCATYWADGLTYPAACATAIAGTVADGGACVVDFDCATATSGCDATTKKCGPSTQARVAPVDGPVVHVANRLHL